jgi:hypothetical protein
MGLITNVNRSRLFRNGVETASSPTKGTFAITIHFLPKARDRQVQETNKVIHAASPRRTLLDNRLRTGGWQIRDSAGLVGGFFRDRSTALKSVVREKWIKDAVVELSPEAVE